MSITPSAKGNAFANTAILRGFGGRMPDEKVFISVEMALIRGDYQALG